MPRFFKVIGIQWHKRVITIFIAFTIMTSMASNCISNPCMYGICVDDLSSFSSYRCYCIDGYTGINCETNWNDCWSNPCLNGGTCTDAVASYNCSCLEGFVGMTCEQKYSECMNYPCQNNGTCLDYNGFTCQCLEGFSGDFCEIDTSVCNNTICKNFGECIEGPGLSFMCNCQNGWAGKYCEEDVNECNLLPCQNGGLCINVPGTYTCACLFGYTGKDCDKNIVPCQENPCRNNAICLFEDGQSVCYCVPDYHGTFCELQYNDCESKSVRCENGGSCIDGINNFTCSCPSQYTGERCTLVVETTSMDVPMYNSDVYTTEKAVPFDINTMSYTIQDDDTVVTSTENCLRNSCVTTINGEEPELVTIQNSTDKTIDTTQFTNVKEVLTIQIESRTEYDQMTFTTLGQNYTTMPEETPLLTSVSQDLSSKAINVTTFKTYAKSMDEIYPVQTSENNIFQTTIETPFGNESLTQAFTLDELDESTTMRSINSNDINQSSTTVGATAKAPVTDVSTEIPVYLDTVKTTLTPAIELTWPETTTESLVASSVERSTDADYNEAITLNSTSFSVTENITPDITTAPMVIMVPSTIIPEQTASNAVTQLDFNMPDNTEMFSRSPTTMESKATSTTSDDDFTTVTEFFKTTYGTEMIKSEMPNVVSTTEYEIVYSCTKDQCANTSLCLHNGTQCDCSYWNNCRISPSIEHAAFSGKSYIRQKFTIENGILKIFVRLKTRAKSGIFIHTLFDDERYILLYMEMEQLKFQFSCGLQTMLLGELDLPINNGYNVDIEMRFQYTVEDISDKCSGQLIVNNTLAMSGEQVLQSHESIPQFARLHLGGIPLTFSQPFAQIAMGFIGCMSSLKVNGINRDFLRDSAEAVQIQFMFIESVFSGETCERTVCDNNPCHLGATCLISPGVNFICVCPLGTHGLYCEKDTTVVQPSFSAILPGFSSYIAYGVSSSVKDHMELKMRIIPQTLEQIALIAYMGQSNSMRESSDHFSITYVRGYLMLTWDLGSGVKRIFTNSPLNIRTNKVHTLQFGRRGRDSWLYVNGIGNITGRAAGTNTRLDVSPILYIGGHKSKYFEMLPHDLPLHTGFSGCIYDIVLHTDDNVFPITMSSPATGRGVGECHRNECSHHSCKNGAVCLNYGPTYR
ncbi:PREDICTED: protein eyes shut [Ceratosolen solmsi marchali]|uniref:Protein eyes shut n=1 Tax=Ceratosolen solmsi marchali TaxID=326594 RepID=A0AAJ6VKW2_9HYME|nr:PREDICTED: protein eyes shut [Ceratosolen solmsi marchali]